MTNLAVLIVDDDPTVLYLHRAVVRASKVSENPVCLAGGAETLEYFLEHDTPDTTYLVLLDINMPGMTGWELMDIVAKRRYANRVFFVIVTSSVDSADRERAHGYKCVVGFFEKPLVTADLVNVFGDGLKSLSNDFSGQAN